MARDRAPHPAWLAQRMSAMKSTSPATSITAMTPLGRACCSTISPLVGHSRDYDYEKVRGRGPTRLGGCSLLLTTPVAIAPPGLEILGSHHGDNQRDHEEGNNDADEHPDPDCRALDEPATVATASASADRQLWRAHGSAARSRSRQHRDGWPEHRSRGTRTISQRRSDRSHFGRR